MESQKLRVKIGVHEFDAEGPPEAVSAQFEAWRSMVASLGQDQGAAQKVRDQKPHVGDHNGDGGVGPVALASDIFNFDEKRKLLSLTVHPTGEARDADALLLLLGGYKQVRQLDEVPVTLLKDSMEQSGILISRIDRAIAPHLAQGLVLKGGHGKGGKYRLTVLGARKADEITRKLLEQLV